MHYITGSDEVHNHRYGAARESFEHYTGAIVAKSRKQEHIGRSHPAKNLCLADPAAEGNSLLDSKRSCELLDPISFRPVTDHGEVSQIAPQKGSGPAQSKITSLPGNQAANKQQLKFTVALGPPRIIQTGGAADAGLRDKKQLIAVFGKFGIRLGRSGYDGRRVAIRGPGKRKKPVQIA